jgi:hypothetical protein
MRVKRQYDQRSESHGGQHRGPNNAVDQDKIRASCGLIVFGLSELMLRIAIHI